LLAGSPRRALLTLLVLAALAACGYAAGRGVYLEYHLRAAAKALERRELALARDHAARALELAPDNAWGHFLAGRAARRDSRWDEAEQHLAECRRLRWRQEQVDLERMLLAVGRGDARAEPHLRRLVEENHPEAHLVLEVLIDADLRLYRLRDALHDLNAYLERRPDDVRALIGRGWVWEQMLYFADAERNYRRAVEIDPEHREARRRLADTLLVHGTPQEAGEHFRRLLEGEPDDPHLLLGLARARRKTGEDAEARRLLQALLDRDPEHGGGLTELGLVALDEGKNTEAAQLLQQAVARSPYDRQAHDAYYRSLLLLGRDVEAAACKEKLDRIDADLKRLDDISRKLIARPGDVALRHEMGVLLLRNGEEARGVRCLLVALEIEPGHRDSHKVLAEYYERTGQKNLAARHRRFAPAE
jgi:tetratricopeptide (TPR) repeat protein